MPSVSPQDLWPSTRMHHPEGDAASWMKYEHIDIGVGGADGDPHKSDWVIYAQLLKNTRSPESTQPVDQKSKLIRIVGDPPERANKEDDSRGGGNLLGIEVIIFKHKYVFGPPSVPRSVLRSPSEHGGFPPLREAPVPVHGYDILPASWAKSSTLDAWVCALGSEQQIFGLNCNEVISPQPLGVASTNLNVIECCPPLEQYSQLYFGSILSESYRSRFDLPAARIEALLRLGFLFMVSGAFSSPMIPKQIRFNAWLAGLDGEPFYHVHNVFACATNTPSCPNQVTDEPQRMSLLHGRHYTMPHYG
ncbi:uncharacterized protein EV420DRAFT_1485684 [Desarmillaria tabescens]|uniref:Uncharacterized protein n=1 Tax=Armillaria tabescens TaxID=1929756 RepID=A0AA39JF22_ARMTA|nr:uncharacterized protein EV420DRAFT_1485684 [Desarmillaria tabescens]KAK0441224.1 hypothetical protein EV420DRAFT_1485684 [Desarmillaria tabescens]